jgi:hypothetical protein
MGYRIPYLFTKDDKNNIYIEPHGEGVQFFDLINLTDNRMRTKIGKNINELLIPYPKKYSSKKGKDARLFYCLPLYNT